MKKKITIMKKINTSIMAMVLSLGVQSQVNWKVDASHSKLGFSVTHMMISETEGKFKIYEGSVSSKSDADFTDAQVSFSVDVKSINTDDEKRDGHLTSPDFFDAEKFPKMSFKSESMKKGKNANEYLVTGDLTIKGITKKVTLSAKHSGKLIKTPWSTFVTAFNVTGLINRKDFGLTWNAALEAGGVVVSEEVKLTCTIELIKG